MKATEGNGGAPIRLSKAPIVGPEIPRGTFTLPCRHDVTIITDKLSFVSTSLVPGYELTYHDADVISQRDGRVIVFVGPHDVVTWEPRP